MPDSADRRTADLEALSAYLSADLSEADAAALEARLRQEPKLQENLERLHETVVALEGLDEVVPPEGFADRLLAGLGVAAEEVPVEAEQEATVVELAPRRPRWAVIGTVAAGVLVVAVAGISLSRFPGADQRDDDVAAIALEDGAAPEGAFDAMEAEAGEAMPDAGAMPPSAGRQYGPQTMNDLSGASDPAVGLDAQVPFVRHGQVGGPVIIDEDVALPDDDAVRERYSLAEEAEAVWGAPLERARDLEAAHRVAVQRVRESFSNGAHPADCLDAVTVGAQAPVVIVRVESAVSADAPALGYLLVTATQGATTLDRIEAWVLDAATCTPRIFQTVR